MPASGACSIRNRRNSRSGWTGSTRSEDRAGGGSGAGRWVDRSNPSSRHREVRYRNGYARIGAMARRGSGGGLARHGVEVEFAGVTTTPGVAYLAKNGPFAAGVMISASHNPYQDNGIKLIGHAGYKLPDEQEEALEKEIFRCLDQGAYSPPARSTVNEGLDRAYMDHLAATLPGGLDGLKIVADCANGSASILAPELFERLGARVHRDPLLARRPQHQSELRLAASGSAAGGSAGAKCGCGCRVRWRCRSRFVRIAIRKDHRWRCGVVPHGAVLEGARTADRRRHPPCGRDGDVQSGPGAGAARTGSR